MAWNMGYYAYPQAAPEPVPEDTNSGDETVAKTSVGNKSNALPVWGNERTMNLNPLVLTNIQNSHYFKTDVAELKTYHEVVDEIYYKVDHLEPWERGSRKTTGQTGMCGGVRGVGAGGIVSTAYCLLYKLFTLRLTRKQLVSLIKHKDSPYIRGLGFMYIRYTQPPADLWTWYEPYLDDEEEIDPKAGGGQPMTIGVMLRQFLTKLEWYETLFPRIPVPIQINMDKKMGEKYPAVAKHVVTKVPAKTREETPPPRERPRHRSRSRSRSPRDRGSSTRHRDRERDRERDWERDRDRNRDRDRYRDDRRSERDRDRERERRDRDRRRRDDR